MLRQAAGAADWQRDVIHRCAWCSQVVGASDTQGVTPEPGTDSVAAETHVMCAACAERALDYIAVRRRRPRAA